MNNLSFTTMIDNGTLYGSSLLLLLDQYKEDLLGYEAHLSIDDKNFSQSVHDQIGWNTYYKIRLNELKSISRGFEHKLDIKIGELTANYNENYNTKLPVSVISKYVDREEIIRLIVKDINECKEVTDMYDAVCEGFKSRGFLIKSITESKVHNFYDEDL